MPHIENPPTVKKIFVLSMALCGLLFLIVNNAHASAPALPKKQSWVMDPTGILSQSALDDIARNAKTHEKQTSDQVVTLIIRSLNGWTMEKYSKMVANKLAIGQKGKNNGVLLIVAINDRKVRIEVGAGLEDVITDEIAQSIIDNEILPLFKLEAIEYGVIAGHKAIFEALGGEYRDKTLLNRLIVFLMLPFFFIARLFGGEDGDCGFEGGGFEGGGGFFDGGGATGEW
jgi:uncharacterized protein